MTWDGRARMFEARAWTSPSVHGWSRHVIELGWRFDPHLVTVKAHLSQQSNGEGFYSQWKLDLRVPAPEGRVHVPVTDDWPLDFFSNFQPLLEGVDPLQAVLYVSLMQEQMQGAFDAAREKLRSLVSGELNEFQVQRFCSELRGRAQYV